MIPRPPNPLVVALDVSDLDTAERLAGDLAPHVGMLKVGLELCWAEGPDAVRRVMAHGPVFVDAKLNVHALGGEAMMRAAVDGAARGAEQGGHPSPLVIAVTVLSSMSGEELASPTSLAFEARTAGLDGVVVSGSDVADVRQVCGEDFCLVVPGIRPPGANGDDQVRVLSPSAALDAGADYLVVGRPITASDDPVGVAKGIVLGAR
jgi:orotidine-5'-phosphate decarboxylase